MSTQVLDNETALVFIENSGAEYRPIRKVSARQLDAPHEWNTSKGDTLVARPGDWVLQNGQREWTVDEEIFAQTYQRNTDGTYSKTSTVRAVQVKIPVSISTLEGQARACPGDWLVANTGGDVWPIPNEEFTEAYAPV